MRIAWLGPTPNEEGGAPYVGTLLLRELVDAGAQVDCFLDVGWDEIPPALLGLDGLRFVLRPTRWRWGSWYNRTPLAAFVSGALFRLAAAQFALARAVADRHAIVPYDVVYQFSQSELGGLRALRRSLPPIVLHPSTLRRGRAALVPARGAARTSDRAARSARARRHGVDRAGRPSNAATSDKPTGSWASAAASPSTWPPTTGSRERGSGSSSIRSTWSASAQALAPFRTAVR